MNERGIRAIEELTKQLKLINEADLTSQTPEVLLSIVPLVGVVTGSVLLFFFLLWRYRLHRELILSGRYVPSFWKNLRIFSLLIGSLSAAIGLPMTVLFFLIDGLAYSTLGGLIPFFAGIGFILFYLLARHHEDIDT
jgi:pilus assembly protein TadC